MASAAKRQRPTFAEFGERIGLDRDDRRLLRAYFRILRRRRLGQTAAVIGALLALDFGQTEIADGLHCRRRRVAGHWKTVRERFAVRGTGALVRFLHDRRAWPEGRRPKPTPQERPFARVVPEVDEKRYIGRRLVPNRHQVGGSTWRPPVHVARG